MVPEAAADIGHCRSVRFRRLPDTSRGYGVRGGQRPSGQRPAPHAQTHRGHCRGVRFRRIPAGVPGQVGAASGHRRCRGVDSGRGLRTPAARGCPRCGHPRRRQGHADTTAGATLDSRQDNRPPATPCRTRNGTAMSDTGLYRHGVTARSVAWCSASIWSAPVGSGLLRSEASSMWSDRDGSRRIVWMINRMIKQARVVFLCLGSQHHHGLGGWPPSSGKVGG